MAFQGFQMPWMAQMYASAGNGTGMPASPALSWNSISMPGASLANTPLIMQTFASPSGSNARFPAPITLPPVPAFTSQNNNSNRVNESSEEDNGGDDASAQEKYRRDGNSFSAKKGDECETDRSIKRRRRVAAASKRSRQKRKAEFETLKEENQKLKMENMALKMQILGYMNNNHLQSVNLQPYGMQPKTQGHNTGS